MRGKKERLKLPLCSIISLGNCRAFIRAVLLPPVLKRIISLSLVRIWKIRCIKLAENWLWGEKKPPLDTVVDVHHPSPLECRQKAEALGEIIKCNNKMIQMEQF